MKFRIFVVMGLVLAWTGVAVAQQSGGRIDLGRFAEELSGLVSVRAAFEEASVVCPEDRTLLTISNGRLSQLRHNPSPPERWRRLENKMIDDETYRSQYVTDECRFDLLVRMQVLRDGSWTSLLISKFVRHGDQWAAVPLAAIPPPRGQQREVPPQKL